MNQFGVIYLVIPISESRKLKHKNNLRSMELETVRTRNI